ncbi:CbtA family protein [Klenkia taihuensis]|uniref:Probable cobalt transporter subunit (CbtA) n=1 Tax=Klenkia taihuensis TaxID=1225127 RepID=A0A1I1TG45_9ACTN|nr:CbtA family protein [Klenkia taihuensis]GHE12811.1 membrane protein [Klenkia taihuensis]SFD57572.1 Probable cobalt transporter subunit (CbtA) [Klenkia taihuensis]
MAAALDSPRQGTAPRFAPLLGRFALAGVAAGAASGAWALLVTERAIAPALALEESRAGGHEHGEELVGRGTQLVGGFLGTVVAAVVFSVVVAAVYAGVRHRLPGRTDVGRVAVLTAVGFGVFALLPALKMPANPPAVGDPDTVGTRTAIYVAVLGAGVVTALLVSALVGTLRARGLHPSAVATAAVLLAVALVAATVLLVPDNPDTIAADVPAAVVWDFRLASLGQLAVMWTTLGLTAGYLVDRLARRS